MKSLKLARIFALVLVVIIGPCSGSADVTATVTDGGGGVVRSVIYVDESQHVIPNKNCTDTDNRFKISDIPDEVVVTHEDDHSNCRGSACQVDKRGGVSNPKVNLQNQPEVHNPVIPLNPDCAKLFPNSHGIRCSVFVDRLPVGMVGGGSQTLGLGNTVNSNAGGRFGMPNSGPQTITQGIGGRTVIPLSSVGVGSSGFHTSGLAGGRNGGFQTSSQNSGGSPIIHVIGGGSSTIPAISPSRVVINDGQISQGGFSNQGSADRVLHIIQKPRIPNRSVEIGSFNVPRRNVKYLQIVGDRDGQAGGRTYTYRIKGIRHPGRYVSEGNTVVRGGTGTSWVRNRGGFSSGNRGSFSINSGTGYRPTSGGSFTVLEEDQFTGYPSRDGDEVEISTGRRGYFDDSYSDYIGDEATIELIETGSSGRSSQAYGDVEVIDEGFTNDAQAIEAGSGGYGDQVYVSEGYFADGHSSSPHYDTVNEYYYHHS